MINNDNKKSIFNTIVSLVIAAFSNHQREHLGIHKIEIVSSSKDTHSDGYVSVFVLIGSYTLGGRFYWDLFNIYTHFSCIKTITYNLARINEHAENDFIGVQDVRDILRAIIRKH